MIQIHGRVTHLQIYEEEGGHDWFLCLSRFCWYGICVAAPLSVWRFFYDLGGLVYAILGVLMLAVIIRLLGPIQVLAFDEVMCRLFPRLRAAFRLGLVRIWDLRLRLANNQEVACLLRGDLVGAAPVVGDRLRLQGRIRGGTLRVHSGTNETTGALVAPRPVRTGWVLAITAAVLGFFILYLYGVFDEPLYGLLAYLLDIEEQS
ncbi:MAG: hypothetical protein BZ151_09500 [Desulfobacca sp. 4484_104]|nr:MAG: hypothetical protein BZ151_09500 [Desulfobacca sp. 4484_104]